MCIRDRNKVELQELSGFTLSLKGLKKVSPSAARDGYRYYQFPAAADGTTLVLGFSTDALFSKTTPIHVLLTIPEDVYKRQQLALMKKRSTPAPLARQPVQSSFKNPSSSRWFRINI